METQEAILGPASLFTSDRSPPLVEPKRRVARPIISNGFEPCGPFPSGLRRSNRVIHMGKHRPADCAAREASIREISRRPGLSRNTITNYRTGVCDTGTTHQWAGNRVSTANAPEWHWCVDLHLCGNGWAVMIASGLNDWDSGQEEDRASGHARC